MTTKASDPPSPRMSIRSNRSPLEMDTTCCYYGDSDHTRRLRQDTHWIGNYRHRFRGMLHFIRTEMPSPASEGISNLMNILTSNLLVLEQFSNVMNVFTLIVGAFLA